MQKFNSNKKAFKYSGISNGVIKITERAFNTSELYDIVLFHFFKNLYERY